MRLLMPQSGSRDFLGGGVGPQRANPRGMGCKPEAAMPVAFPVALNVRFGPP